MTKRVTNKIIIDKNLKKRLKFFTDENIEFLFSSFKINFRIPFESSNKECCRNTVFNGEGIQMEIFGIVVVHECHNMDGVAVKSKPGEPYNYITL